MKVAKFGGSSLADAKQIKKVCNIIVSDPERRIIVVSAPGKRFDDDTKVTDLLILLATACLEKKDGREELKNIIERFSSIAKDLNIIKEMQSTYDNLEKMLTLDKSNPTEFMDTVKATGEDTLAKTLATYLQSIGYKAKYVNPGEAGMILTNEYGNAQLLDESYERLAQLSETKEIIIFPGFFGVTLDGKIATFPRGGSDITGAILASAVKADVYENFTDVDYVYSVSPKIIKSPTPILEATYREMRELSSSGFSVYQEEALRPVYKHGIPVNIRNSNNPNCKGTMIVPELSKIGEKVIGIAYDSDFCCIYITKYLMNREVGFGRKLLKILEDNNISYEHTPTGIDNISVVFKQNQLPKELKADIVSKIYNELDADDVRVDYNLGMIVLVGEGMANSSTAFLARATTALSKADVNIEMISQGSSKTSMVIAVHESKVKLAMQKLYNEFFDNNNSTIL